MDATRSAKGDGAIVDIPEARVILLPRAALARPACHVNRLCPCNAGRCCQRARGQGNHGYHRHCRNRRNRRHVFKQRWPGNRIRDGWPPDPPFQWTSDQHGNALESKKKSRIPVGVITACAGWTPPRFFRPLLGSDQLDCCAGTEQWATLPRAGVRQTAVWFAGCQSTPSQQNQEIHAFPCRN